MDRQRTTSIRQTKKETHDGSRYGSFQPQRTNQRLNRHIEICLLGHPGTTMRRREMETSGLPIEDYARR